MDKKVNSLKPKNQGKCRGSVKKKMPGEINNRQELFAGVILNHKTAVLKSVWFNVCSTGFFQQ